MGDAAQVARLQREERLGALQIELASGKLLRLTQLRGFARVVLFAGSPEQVRQVVESAEGFREDLIQRGVLLVGLPIYGDSLADATGVAPLKQNDLKCAQLPPFNLLPRSSGLCCGRKRCVHSCTPARRRTLPGLVTAASLPLSHSRNGIFICRSCVCHMMRAVSPGETAGRSGHLDQCQARGSLAARHTSHVHARRADRRESGPAGDSE